MRDGQFFRVSHSLATSAKLRELRTRFPAPLAAGAFGVWTLAGVYASIHRTDGVVPLWEFRSWGDDEFTTDALAALVSVDLIQFESESEMRITSWSDHNRTRSEIEETSQKRKKSGRLGGVAKAVASARGVARGLPEHGSWPPVSASASVFDLNSDPDPEPRTRAVEPFESTVRGALVVGYRAAFEKTFKAMPTDVRGSDADEAVRAVLARASVLERDPRELASKIAPFWFETRSAGWKQPPRWAWFLKDIGALLADAAPSNPPKAPAESEISWAV